MAAPTSAWADSTFPAPAYSSAACTPQQTNYAPGLGPQQWNSAVGLPLSPSGTPAAQRIVIGEFDESASQISVSALLAQCGLDPVTLGADTNPWFPVASAPGAEATLDAAVVAAALPDNASIVMAYTAGTTGWYGLLVTAADACGLSFSTDPSITLPQLSPGPNYPAGGCIISLSYGSAESAVNGTSDQSNADWMMQEFEDNGVIVVVSAGDEGSGGCMATSGLNFSSGIMKTVTQASITSNVMTLTAANHGFTVGQPVFIGNIAPDIDRMYTVVTVPNVNTFTVAVNHADVPATPFNAVAAVNFGGLIPQFPASHPTVLAVGGTQWDSQQVSMATGVSSSYTPGASVQNYTWRDSSPNSNCGNLIDFPTSGGQATGGGQSLTYAMPSYQQTQAQAAYSTLPAKRMMPDLAALAGWPGYSIANWGIPIAYAGVATNVASIYLNQTAQLTVGEQVVISDMAGPFTGLNGTRTITGVTASTLTFDTTTTDAPLQAVNAGTATQTCASYPCLATEFPWTAVVGTSAATPLVAVGISNVNAVLSSRGMSRIDNAGGSMDIHSIVYNPSYRSAFTDVVYGNNDLQGLGGWDALTGYDMVTGMGVPNFSTLADLLIAAQTPAPAPSGGGSSQLTTTATPVATVEAPVQVGSGPGQAVPTPTTTALAPGVLVATGPKATNAPRVRADRSASRRLDRAPMIEMPIGKWSVPVVKVPGVRSPMTAQIRVNGVWTDLGVFTPTDNGVVSMPSMRLTRAGTYPVRMQTEDGRRYFAQLDVARPTGPR